MKLAYKRTAKNNCKTSDYSTLLYDVASESVIKSCIKNDNPLYANYLVTLCVDIHKNVAFSYGEILTF